MKREDDSAVRSEPQCLTPGCKGYLFDVHPAEQVRADGLVLVRVECPLCHARAWRILPESTEKEAD